MYEIKLSSMRSQIKGLIKDQFFSDTMMNTLLKKYNTIRV